MAIKTILTSKTTIDPTAQLKFKQIVEKSIGNIQDFTRVCRELADRLEHKCSAAGTLRDLANEAQQAYDNEEYGDTKVKADVMFNIHGLPKYITRLNTIYKVCAADEPTQTFYKHTVVEETKNTTDSGGSSAVIAIAAVAGLALFFHK
jgi:hypothetical protein